MAESSSDGSECSRSIEGISKGVASMYAFSDDCGEEPSELYGKYTWMITKFSQINMSELRSNAFEIGGHKWYILIYPKGCDVSDYLSIFLCTVNHDKLPIGWSHFAQFTISVVNKDPKKSKYSDTVHRYWKKEHDWGWKKFMELSKLSDGFLDDDTVVIKAQVQVIREKSDRPFRCLAYPYRSELLRVYLSNVESICGRFVEEKRRAFRKLMEDKVRWSSFCGFWMGIDQKYRDDMSQAKWDSILPKVVKHFFVEKEVPSTLVMESLCMGLTALKEPSMPIIRIDEGSFILVDDLLLLLEREAMQPSAPKVEGESSEFSSEKDEKRLTELGSQTIEVYALAHIFSKIEVAFEETVPHALKLQEELIHEQD